MSFPRILTASKKASFLTTATLLIAISACVTVSPPHQHCPGSPGSKRNVNRNTPKSITLVATDADTGDTLTYTVVSLPSSGTLLDPNGSHHHLKRHDCQPTRHSCNLYPHHRLHRHGHFYFHSQ